MHFCCLTDIIQRKLPSSGSVRYPTERDALLLLMHEDQSTRNDIDFLKLPSATSEVLKQQESYRASTLKKILDHIETPSVQNIGMDGARAAWLIALHNCTMYDVGRRMLSQMQKLYINDRSQVFAPGIPYLTDRLMVIDGNFDHSTHQLYGTQRWRRLNSDNTITHGTFPIAQRSTLSERLREYSIDPNKRCRHGK